MGRCMVMGPKEFAVRHDSFHFSVDGGERIRRPSRHRPRRPPTMALRTAAAVA